MTVAINYDIIKKYMNGYLGYLIAFSFFGVLSCRKTDEIQKSFGQSQEAYPLEFFRISSNDNYLIDYPFKSALNRRNKRTVGANSYQNINSEKMEISEKILGPEDKMLTGLDSDPISDQKSKESPNKNIVDLDDQIDASEIIPERIFTYKCTIICKREDIVKNMHNINLFVEECQEVKSKLFRSISKIVDEALVETHKDLFDVYQCLDHLVTQNRTLGIGDFLNLLFKNNVHFKPTFLKKSLDLSNTVNNEIIDLTNVKNTAIYNFKDSCNKRFSEYVQSITKYLIELGNNNKIDIESLEILYDIGREISEIKTRFSKAFNLLKDSINDASFVLNHISENLSFKNYSPSTVKNIKTAINVFIQSANGIILKKEARMIYVPEYISRIEKAYYTFTNDMNWCICQLIGKICNVWENIPAISTVSN